MKTMLFFGLAVSLMTLHSCQRDNRPSDQKENQPAPPVKHESPEKMIEGLVGDWEQTGNQSRQDNASQILTFTEEARYILRQGGQKIDSGAYRMNEQLQNLYLESEANEDPREYELRLSRDTLILSPKEGSQKEGRRVYVKRN